MGKRTKEGLGAGKPRPGAAKPPADDRPPPTQREKFIQTAREIGADETGDALDEALRTIGRARPKAGGAKAAAEKGRREAAIESDKTASRKATEGSRGKRRRGGGMTGEGPA